MKPHSTPFPYGSQPQSTEASISYEIARRMRVALGQAVLLVAITGHSNESDCLQALSAGFDVHMTKPVDIELLEQMLETK